MTWRDALCTFADIRIACVRRTLMDTFGRSQSIAIGSNLCLVDVAVVAAIECAICLCHWHNCNPMRNRTAPSPAHDSFQLSRQQKSAQWKRMPLSVVIRWHSDANNELGHTNAQTEHTFGDLCV